MTTEIYGADHEVARHAHSPENERLLSIIDHAFNEIDGPRVGDFAVFPDGHEERFSHHWGDGLQTTDGRFGASFSIGKNGYASFSGGLNPLIPIERIVLTAEVKPGSFWFFARDWPSMMGLILGGDLIWAQAAGPRPCATYGTHMAGRWCPRHGNVPA